MSRVFQKDKAWWIDFNDAQGIRHRKKVGPDKRIAKEVLDDLRGKVARRVHLGVIADSTISFADFARVWQERVFPTLAHGTKERWQRIGEHLKQAFPGTLRSMTLDQAEAYRRQRLGAGAAAATVNKETMVLKHMYSRAVGWKYLSANPLKDPANPTHNLKKFKEPPGRTRFLPPKEIDQLLAACDVTGFKKTKGHFFSELVKGYLKPLVLLALNSGMRRGELLALTRKDVDWTNRIATLEVTKNGDKRHVYLNAGAQAALKALPARLDTDRLFPFPPKAIGSAFRRAVKRAGLTGFRFHDLRHTFCSYHAMSGVQGRGLQDLMGHRDGRMTARYSHLSDVYLREAVNRVVLGAEIEQSETQHAV